jgi:regulator of protease activity HflC (stomatin/prohibitin superfamily)
MRKSVLVSIAVLLFAFSTGCTRVSPGHVGIVVNQWGTEKGVADYAAKTGTFTYNPFTTSVFEYPTYVQNYVWTANPNEGRTQNEEITFTIKGNMAISLDVSIAYRLDPVKVPSFYVQFRSDDLQAFTHGFLHNVTRDCFNEEGGRFELDQIMGDNAAFILSVRKQLEGRVGQYGVIIEQFGIIGAPRPPKEVQAAITAKIGATQLAIQKQNELVQAQADAAKTVAKAEGDAKSTLLLAETQAKANRLLNDSLSDRLVQYRAIDKWNGALPQYTGGGAVPFINVK